MIFCFDLDNTICTTNGDKYEEAKPMNARIQKINQLFDNGHIIKIFTARGSGTGIDWTQLTLNQLRNWHVSYHTLLFGKPEADVFIDDKAHNSELFDWKLN